VNRHCERSEAIQMAVLLDCFAALAMTGDAEIRLDALADGQYPCPRKQKWRLVLPPAATMSNTAFPVLRPSWPVLTSTGLSPKGPILLRACSGLSHPLRVAPPLRGLPSLTLPASLPPSALRLHSARFTGHRLGVLIGFRPSLALATVGSSHEPPSRASGICMFPPVDNEDNGGGILAPR
jgi:hypothetical protein